MVSLERLLCHAGVPPWHQRVFLKDCIWAAPCLLIHGREEAEFVARSWGAKMRELVPDLSIRVLKVAPVEAKPKTARPLWKKGREPRQDDLL